MERDFMGLGSSNHPTATVKEEVADSSSSAFADAFNDSVINMKSSGGGAHQWSFSNKVSAVPQFLSFQTGPDQEKPRRSFFDPVASSSSFMSISNADAFDSGNRRGSSAITQKTWNFENKTEISHRPRPMQHHTDASNDIRTFPLSNQHQHHPLPVTMSSTPILQSRFASTLQSGYYGNSITIQPAPVPASPLPVIPSTSSVIGTTELRNSPKLSGSSAQLTIFYAGSVCVYDDVSSEQAQAILSMAETSSSTPQQTAPFRPTHLATDDHILRNRSPPGSSVPSPISVSSSTSNESGTARSLAASSSIHISPIPISSSQPASAAPVSSITVGPPQVRIPQAREASLARFLEKRKERITSQASPYHSISKKSAEGHVCV